MINAKIIQEAIGITIPAHMVFDDLGLVSMQHASRLITFVDNHEFISETINNPNIVAAFVTNELEESFAGSSIYPIVVDDPRWYYYTLLNHLAKKTRENFSTRIDSSTIVDPTAFIAPQNIKIGEHCIIEPNVTILGSVEIGKECVVRAGAVLGINGFEMKRTSHGMLPVEHDGKVIIGNRVEIGPNNSIIKGFRFLAVSCG